MGNKHLLMYCDRHQMFTQPNKQCQDLGYVQGNKAGGTLACVNQECGLTLLTASRGVFSC